MMRIVPIFEYQQPQQVIVLVAECSLLTKLRQQHMLNELAVVRLQCLLS